MPRKSSQVNAESSYRSRHKRVTINFHLQKDAYLLEWLRSNVDDESKIPAFIKQVLVEYSNA